MKKSILTLCLFLSILNLYSQIYADLDMFCVDIKIEKDKVAGETRYTTPFEKQVSFKKLANSGVEVSYMTLSATSSSPEAGKGIEIYLDQGRTIIKDVITNVYESGEGQYVHYAEFRLSKDDISKLRNYNIANFKVFRYSSIVENTLIYKGYMYCLKNLH